MLDTGMDAIDSGDDPAMDNCRASLGALFASLLSAGYDAGQAALMLAWPAHELDVEFYFEPERAH